MELLIVARLTSYAVPKVGGTLTLSLSCDKHLPLEGYNTRKKDPLTSANDA